MSESPTLAETLARLDVRIAENGLDRGEVLDTRALSDRTAVPEGGIRATRDGPLRGEDGLLRGEDGPVGGEERRRR